jgi:hypothetical protein
VILVKIAAIMSEDEVGRKVFFQLLEIIFDLCAIIGEVPIPEILEDELTARGLAQEEPGGASCLLRPEPVRARAKHHPVNLHAAALSEELQERTPTTDFDIVTMSAKAKHAQRPIVP